MLDKISIDKIFEPLEDGLRRRVEEEQVRRDKVIPVWVTKKITKTEWKNYYSYHISYCLLREEDGKLVIGFMVTNQVPDSCLPMTDDEIYIMNEYCKSRNIYPSPLEISADDLTNNL